MNKISGVPVAHIVSSPRGNTAMAIVRRLGLHNTISAIFSNFSIIFILIYVLV